MPSLAPIQTNYMGYKFRSRLEARWAVFFETCSFDWEYEKEGYRFEDGTCYLPDFWIDNLKIWVEIKPPGTYEGTKQLIQYKEDYYYSYPIDDLMNRMVDATDFPILLIEGTPGKEHMMFWCEETTDSSGGTTQCDDVEWVSCNGIITLDLKRGRDHSIYGGGLQHFPWLTYYQEFPTFKLPVKMAYQAARSARFEHGENTTWI